MLFRSGFVPLVLIAYATADVGMCRLLAWRPIALAGQTTYTIYLVHWPVFLWWESLRLDLSLPRWRIPGTDWVLVDRFWSFCIKTAITLVIVTVIYRLIEDPVRRRRRWVGRRLFVWLGVVALVGIAFTVVGRDRRASADDLLSTLDQNALELQQAVIAELPDVPVDAPTRASADATLPARLLFVGDSQSWVLAAGLDANTALPGGETALMTAARSGHTDVVGALLAGGNPVASLADLASNGDSAAGYAATDSSGYGSTARRPIRRNRADVNAREQRYGDTALMWAAAAGQVDVVRLLIEAGADVRAAVWAW